MGINPYHRGSGYSVELDEDVPDRKRVMRVARAWPSWSADQISRVLDIPSDKIMEHAKAAGWNLRRNS